MKKIALVAPLVALCLLSLPFSPALAQEAEDAAASTVFRAAPLPAPDFEQFPVLVKLRADQPDLAFDYIGKVDDMDVWLRSGPNLMQAVYVLPSGHAMLGGELVGNDAQVMAPRLLSDFMTRMPQRAKEILAVVQTKSQDQAAQTGAASVATPAAARSPVAVAATPSQILWRDLQQAGQVSYGDNPEAPVVYAILDPAQDQSKQVWRHLAPLAKANRIVLHVVPLAMATGDSIMDIASVLGGDNPPVLWEKLMAGGAVQGGDAPNGEKVIAIEKTVQLAQRLKLRTLPFLVYRLNGNEAAARTRIIRGVPRDWTAFKAELSPGAAQADGKTGTP